MKEEIRHKVGGIRAPDAVEFPTLVIRATSVEGIHLRRKRAHSEGALVPGLQACKMICIYLQLLSQIEWLRLHHQALYARLGGLRVQIVRVATELRSARKSSRRTDSVASYLSYSAHSENRVRKTRRCFYATIHRKRCRL